MGYTHYFPQSRSFDAREWQQVKEDCKKIIASCIGQSIPLQYEFNDSRPVVINENHVRFNGVGNDGHETFFVSKKMTHRDYEDKSQPAFQFCKTARKPYDLAVCLCLLRIKAIAPDAIGLSSDGSWDGEWVTARQQYQELFKEEPMKWSN
jgi:hypothetical protein